MEVAGSPVNIASLGVQVCQDLLSFYDSWKGSDADITALYDCVDDLCKTFKLLEKTLEMRSLDEARSKRVEQCLGSCMGGVKKLQEKFHTLQAHDVPSAFQQQSSVATQTLSSPPEKSICVQLREVALDLGEPLSLAVQVLRLDVDTDSLNAPTQIEIGEEKANFEYNSLNYDQHDFRLLRLLRSRTGPIECELDHAALRSKTCPRYDALSYTWGDLDLVETIKVNNKTLRVTDNLHTALCHLRLHDQDRVLWIDAICIDQTNAQERSSQVMKMGDIFRHAHKVVIWLGKATVEIDFLMRWLREVKKQSLSGATPGETEEQLRKGMHTLLQRPWFSRVWIIPEVANARSAIVCTGEQSISAHLFAHAAAAVGLTVGLHCSSVLDLMLRTSKLDFQSDQEADLGRLILKFQECRASDERDKIYALLGMSSNHQDTAELSPDYSLYLHDVVDKAARYLFKITQCSIGEVLDFFTSFRSITAVCLVPCIEQSYLGTGKEQDRDIKCKELLTNLFNQIGDNERTLLWYIGEQRNIQDQVKIDTFCSQVTHLSNMQKDRFESSKEKAKTLIWNRFEQNVKVVLIANSAEELLMAALYERHEKVAEMLLHQGAEGNAQGGEYSNALQAASSRGYEKVVEMLLERGADVNAQGGFYSNALQAASSIGDEKVVSMLLERGADVNAKGGFFGNALHAASYEGDEKVVSMLLERGADVNAKGGSYGNALQVASLRGHEEVVSILLERGAEVNAREGFYGNALQVASNEGHEKLVSMLLERGADVYGQGGFYRNALHAASSGGHEKVMEVLIAKGERKDILSQ